MNTSIVLAFAALLCFVQASPFEVADSYANSTRSTDDVLQGIIARVERAREEVQKLDKWLEIALPHAYAGAERLVELKAAAARAALLAYASAQGVDGKECIAEDNPFAKIGQELLDDIRVCVLNEKSQVAGLKNALDGTLAKFQELPVLARQAIEKCRGKTGADRDLCYLPFSVQGGWILFQTGTSARQSAVIIVQAQKRIGVCALPAIRESKERGIEVVKAALKCIREKQ